MRYENSEFQDDCANRTHNAPLWLGAWLAAFPVAFVFGVAIPSVLSLNMVWGVPIYILAGATTGVILSLLGVMLHND